jgi:hypothetical protein
VGQGHRVSRTAAGRAHRHPRRVKVGAVHDERWSLLERLRHLVFVTDAWIGSVVRTSRRPTIRSGYHPTSSRTRRSSTSTPRRDRRSKRS